MKSRRIGFSRWTTEDRELAFLLWGDPDVSRYICASGVFSQNEILSRLSLEVERGEELGGCLSRQGQSVSLSDSCFSPFPVELTVVMKMF